MIRHVRNIFTGFVFTAALSCSVFASAQTIYVSTGAPGAATGAIGTITTAGVYTQIGTTSTELFGIAFSPTGVLYGAGQNAAGTITIYTVNPTTAALTQVGSTGLNGGLLSEQAAGLAFSPGGTLFLADTNPPLGNSSRLFTVNTSNGAVTQVGFIGNQTSATIGFDGSGNLFEINNQPAGSNVLDILNQTTGAGTLVGNTANTDVFGLAFSGGQLIGFANAGNRVLNINTATGLGTTIGNFNVGGGGRIILAATPFAVPEPSTLALLMGMGVTGTSVFLRRKRVHPSA